MKTDNLQNCEHHVLICVKSKHGWESGMMSWTDVVLCGREWCGTGLGGVFSSLGTQGVSKRRWVAIVVEIKVHMVE